MVQALNRGASNDHRDHTQAITPCPDWCIVEYDRPGGFHAGENYGPDGHPVRLFQHDGPGVTPDVVAAGQWLNDEQAHELGMELLGLAELVRRIRACLCGTN